VLTELNNLRNLDFWLHIQHNLQNPSIENSYLTSCSFRRLFACPYTISGLGVNVLNIDRAAEIYELIRFKQSENFKLLGLVQVQYQKISNTKLIVNFLNFPFITHTLKSDKQRRSYDRFKLGCCWKSISGQIKLPGQFWTLRLLPLENWKSHEYKGPREFYILSNEG
jgi:hypothetical protein